MNAFFNELQITKSEFLFQFQSHPNYPSALAFSDTLNFMGIKNDAYELEKEFWQELPSTFITYYKGQFAIVDNLKGYYKISTDKTEKITRKELYENTDNFVLLYERVEDVSEKSKINYKWLLCFLISLFLIYSLLLFTWHQILYNVFSILGIIISLDVFNRKFGKESLVINNLCGANNISISKSGCTKIIDTDKINILGLKLSDFSLIYFVGILMLGLFFPSTEFVLKFSSLSSLIVIIYSLSVQIFIEKTFCKICLIIISLLIGQITIASILFQFNFDLKTFLLSSICFIITLFSIIHLNDLLKQKEEFKKSSLINLKFKRNYKIFKRELKENHIVFEFQSSIFFLGNKESNSKISLITNPNCGFCKEAHIMLEKILNKYPNISAQIRFNYFPDNADNELTSLISAFKNIYDKNGEKDFLRAVEFWYIDRNIESFKKKYKSYLNQSNSLLDITAMAEENKNNDISFTPALVINQYQFPKSYNIEDMFYFIDELIEDEEILNEKT